jgi:transposase-like protein
MPLWSKSLRKVESVSAPFSSLVALLIACGIDEAGYRHVLGFALGDKESEVN